MPRPSAVTAATFVDHDAFAAVAEIARGGRRRPADRGSMPWGPSSLGRSETLIVVIKVAILVLFAAVVCGSSGTAISRPSCGRRPSRSCSALGVLFIGY